MPPRLGLTHDNDDDDDDDDDNIDAACNDKGAHDSLFHAQNVQKKIDVGSFAQRHKSRKNEAKCAKTARRQTGLRIANCFWLLMDAIVDW